MRGWFCTCSGVCDKRDKKRRRILQIETRESGGGLTADGRRVDKVHGVGEARGQESEGGLLMARWRVKEYLILAKTIEAETREEAIDFSGFSRAEGEYTCLKMTAKKIMGDC